MKEIVLYKKFRPICCSDDDPARDIRPCNNDIRAITAQKDSRQTFFKFLSHDHLRRGSYTVGGAHRGICGRDDRHSMR